MQQLRQAVAAFSTSKITEKYKGAIDSEAQNWVDNYEEVTTMKGWTDQERYTNFNQFLEDNAKHWYKVSVKLNAARPTDWAALKAAFLDYHLPQDRDKELREKLVNRKQGTESVLQYITHKQVLALDYNSLMPFDEMKRFIIEGMHPSIKQTIIHKENNDFDALRRNAILIEKGIKESSPNGLLPSDTNSPNLADVLGTIVAKMDQVVSINNENAEKIAEIERKSRSRDRHDHVKYDQYGRRIEQRSRDRYINLSRESSVDSNRSHSGDRNPKFRNEFRNNRENYRNRNNYQGLRQNNNNWNRNSDFQPKPIIKKVEFENARNLSKSRDINGNIICFNCGKVGHYSRDCYQEQQMLQGQNRQMFRSQRVNALHTLITNSDDSVDPDNSDSGLIYQIVYVNGETVYSLIDSGSEVCLINSELSDKLGLEILPYSGRKLKGVDGKQINVLGEVEINVEIKFISFIRETIINAVVIKDFDFELLLGNDFNKKAKIIIDCKHKKLFSRDKQGKIIAATDNSAEKIMKTNTIHLLRDTDFNPKTMHMIRVTSYRRTKNSVMSCNVTTDNYLYQKYKLSLSNDPVLFKHGKAYICVMNYNTKPVKIKCGAAIGYFNKINDQDQIQFDEFESIDDLESISSGTLSESIDIAEFDRDFSDSSISMCDLFDPEPQFKKIKTEKFDTNEYEDYEKSHKNWLYYYLIDPGLVENFHLTGKLLFEGEKARLMKEGKDLMQADWSRRFCYHCNHYNCENPECSKITRDKNTHLHIDRAQTDYQKYKDDFVQSLIDEYIENLKSERKKEPIRVMSLRYKDNFENLKNKEYKNESIITKNFMRNPNSITSMINHYDNLLKTKYCYQEVNYDRQSENEHGQIDKTIPQKANEKSLNELSILNCFYKENETKLKLVKGDDELDNVKTIGGNINVNAKLNSNEKNRLRILLNKYNDIFAFNDSKLGLCKNAVFKIEFNEKYQNPIAKKPIPYNFEDRSIIKREVDKLLKLGVIEETNSEWSFPIVLVNKKGLDEQGNQLKRLAIDYRALNDIIKDINYPLPDIQTVLSSQSGKQFFSLLDDNQGYYQFSVAPECRPITAFITQDTIHQFRRIPFGIKSIPSFYQREQTKIFRNLIPNVMICYFDDKLVSSINFEIHLKDLEEVFKLIRKAGLTLKPNKCVFAQNSVEFLGHNLSSEGISATEDKINAITKLKPPEGIKAVRSFVGMIGYFRRFIKNFSIIAKPLTDLTKKVINEC